MTNEEAASEKVHEAIRALLEATVFLLPPSDPKPKLKLVWDEDDPEADRFPFPPERVPKITTAGSARPLAPPPKEVKEEKKEKKEISAFEKKFKKEISKMPQTIQDKIRRALQRMPRLHKGVYEKRATIDGIELYASAKDGQECERRFLQEITVKLLHAEDYTPRKKKKDVRFTEWAEQWFRDVFQPKVTETTFSNEYYRYKNHILPAFGKMNLRDVAPIDCVKFFNKLLAKELARTAESCYGLLNRIFQFAVDSDLLDKNPMRSVKPIKAERKNGVPLSSEEERKLLEEIRGTKHEAVIVLALYTGLRPCEHETARIEGDFIVARNRKQKNVKKIVYKKIPITPMLKPHLPMIRACMENDWKNYVIDAHKTLKRILPNHRLYDLRTTFATRCQQCDVPETVVQVWMGHSPSTLLGKVYTKFDDDYLLKEGKKVKY